MREMTGDLTGMGGWLTQEGKYPVNLRLSMQRWKSVWIPTVIGLFCWGPLSRADDVGQRAVAETRQALRKEGFKTDLADFDVSTTPELRAREAILMEAVVEPTNTMTNRGLPGLSMGGSHPNFLPTVNFWDIHPPNLMEAVESNSAAVVWKLSAPEKPLPQGQGNCPYSWGDLRKDSDARGPQLDRASAAIFAGPIRFDLRRRMGRYKIPPPLSQINGLMRSFNNRLVLALHDGDQAAAWNNLLAATRLVTGWEPGLPQKCHLARFGTTELAFEATWEALQTNGWSDAQLAKLQAEWESVDFFTRLPDTAAYQCASDANAFQRARAMSNSDASFDEFMAWALRFPVMVWQALNAQWRYKQYLEHGSYVDEAAMLLHYRDGELELRRAVQAPTWLDMRRILGVLRPLPFNSQVVDDKALLGRAAMAEAQRRILIAALALERYRARHGAYPNSLLGLAPEFLGKSPVDFMDGQPLRYSLSESGHFIIYSVGLGCMDNGVQLPLRKRPDLFGNRFDQLSASAIVWPLPASLAAVEAFRLDDARMYQQQRRTPGPR